jgi:hypothetical protein
MYLSTRLIIKRILFQSILFLFMVITITLFPVLSAADEDPCRDTGIYIKNQTTLDLWYTLNDGPCTFWGYDHILMIKPEETIIIYRDNNCKTAYCPNNPTYDVCKLVDANQNCRVRILPACVLEDM